MNQEHSESKHSKKIVTKYDSADIHKGLEQDYPANAQKVAAGHTNFYEQSMEQHSISYQDESHEVMIMDQQHHQPSNRTSSDVGDLATIMKPETINASQANSIFQNQGTAEQPRKEQLYGHMQDIFQQDRSLMNTPDKSTQKLLSFDNSFSKTVNSKRNSIMHHEEGDDDNVQQQSIEIKDFVQQIQLASHEKPKSQVKQPASSIPSKINNTFESIKQKGARLIGFEKQVQRQQKTALTSVKLNSELQSPDKQTASKPNRQNMEIDANTQNEARMLNLHQLASESVSSQQGPTFMAESDQVVRKNQSRQRRKSSNMINTNGQNGATDLMAVETGPQKQTTIAKKGAAKAKKNQAGFKDASSNIANKSEKRDELLSVLNGVYNLQDMSQDSVQSGSQMQQIDKKIDQLAKKTKQYKQRKQLKKMLEKHEEDKNRREMMKHTQLAIQKTQFSINNQNRTNTMTAKILNPSGLGNVSRRHSTSMSVHDNNDQSHALSQKPEIYQNCLPFERQSKISPDTLKHQLNAQESVNSQSINLTNVAHSFRNTKSSHNGNGTIYDQSNSLKYGNFNRDFTQKSIFTEMSDDHIKNQLHSKIQQPVKQSELSKVTLTGDSPHQQTKKTDHKEQSDQDQASSIESSISGVDTPNQVLKTQKAMRLGGQNQRRGGQPRSNGQKPKFGAKHKPKIEVKEIDDEPEKQAIGAQSVNLIGSQNKDLLTNPNLQSPQDQHQSSKRKQKSAISMSSSNSKISIVQDSMSSSDSSDSDDEDFEDYDDERSSSESDDQSQSSQEREQMNRQVALLERALSLKKKGGNAEIDLNKLLEESEFQHFLEQSSLNESLDSKNNSSSMHRKKKHHSKTREFDDQNNDKDQILLGLRAPTQVCQEDRKYCLIYPNDKYKSLYWDTLVSAILLITCFLTPLNLAFTEELDLIGWYVMINLIIDLLFLVDIIVNFLTAFHRENHELVDNRCEIIKNYLTGWFIIDFLAILPTDIIVNLLSSDSQQADQKDQAEFNEMVRITRVSKLYKLVRITRLLRLVKLLKQDNKVVNKFGSTLQVSRAFERLSMFLLALVLMCHFVGCMWIFVGRTVPNEDSGTQGWIEAGDFTSMTTTQLYLTSFYFAMTTLTTVGYGDISGNNTTERIICIFLHLIGVISYSIAAGSLTSILQNYDEMNQHTHEKIHVLNRLYKENNLPNDIYYTLLNQIQNYSLHSSQDEIKEFLDDLPFRLKLRTILYIYKDLYSQIPFLNKQIDNFIAWIFPLLNQMFIPMDQYIYYETDQIVEIYFQTSGYSAFVLPFKQNIVYIDIMNGDHFGEIDFFISATEQKMTIAEMMDNLNVMKFNMVRQFTIQAIRDSNYLTMSITNIQRMHKQFNSQFKELFKSAEKTLFRALKQKAKAIRKLDNRHQVLQLVEYARQNPHVRNQVLSEIQKDNMQKDSLRKKNQRSSSVVTDAGVAGLAESGEGAAIGNAIDIMKEVNALFYKRTINLKKIRDDQSISEGESSSNIDTDSSMEQFDDEDQDSFERQKTSEKITESLSKDKKLRQTNFRDDKINERFIQNLTPEEANKSSSSIGMFVGSSKFKPDLFEKHFDADKEAQMTLTSVEQNLKKSMAEQTQKQLLQLSQVDKVQKNIQQQLGDFNQNIFTKHKIKNQIKQRLSDKLVATGKRKSIEANMSRQIAENFRKAQKKSKKSSIIEHPSIEEQSEPDSSSIDRDQEGPTPPHERAQMNDGSSQAKQSSLSKL